MARDLAQEGVDWYFSHVDEYSPNPFNVRNHLRGPMIAITHNILHDLLRRKSPQKERSSFAFAVDEVSINVNKGLLSDEEKKKAAGQGSTGAVNWKDYLTEKEGDSSESISEIYENFGERTKSRLEAFLAGVALAFPNEGPPKPTGKGGKETADEGLSVEEGLAGPSTPSVTVTPERTTNITSLVRRISAGNGDAPKHKYHQIHEEDLLVRLELYIRTLFRAKTHGRECVVAQEPAAALKARTRSVVMAFVVSAGTIHQQSVVLNRLLQCLTMELLAANVLGENLVRAIRRLVTKYEQITSFASLSFLSSPENTAEQKLTPMVLRFLRYLQSNWKECEAECDLERMLALSLDEELRATFKTIEFTSIGHLLEVCQDFRRELQNIELAPDVRCGQNDLDDDSAIKQAVRDLRREVITINGQLLPSVSSHKKLISLLSQTLHSATLPSSKPKRDRRRSSRRASGRGRRSSTFKHISGMGLPDYSADFESSDAEKLSSSDRGGSPSRHRNFDVSTTDLLTKRLLLSACRTGNGGDAYFMVRDLFGGDEIEVVPSQVFPTGDHAVRPTIEIIVRLASVTIKSHGSYDVYPKSLMGDCEPLIQIHTTTTETIGLHEVKASDSARVGTNEEDYSSNDSEAAGEERQGMVVQERKTDQSGWRILSIRPALYEMVEQWSTPS